MRRIFLPSKYYAGVLGTGEGVGDKFLDIFKVIQLDRCPQLEWPNAKKKCLIKICGKSPSTLIFSLSQFRTSPWSAEPNHGGCNRQRSFYLRSQQAHAVVSFFIKNHNPYQSHQILFQELYLHRFRRPFNRNHHFF